MRLIDADALLETLANKLPQWGFKAIDMHVVETLIKNEPTIKTCSASSSCSDYVEDDD